MDCQKQIEDLQTYGTGQKRRDCRRTTLFPNIFNKTYSYQLWIQTSEWTLICFCLYWSWELNDSYMNRWESWMHCDGPYCTCTVDKHCPHLITSCTACCRPTSTNRPLSCLMTKVGPRLSNLRPFLWNITECQRGYSIFIQFQLLVPCSIIWNCATNTFTAVLYFCCVWSLYATSPWDDVLFWYCYNKIY